MFCITGLTGHRAGAYPRQMEPGNKAFVRLAVALRPEDEQQLIELKHHLETKGGQRLSVSEVFRQGIKCLRKREGL
jgi:hypothetical protein